MCTAGNTWNYRVARRAGGDGSTGETFLAIHEAHYEENKEHPAGITKEPIEVTGDTLEELTGVLEMMRAAPSKPILEYDNF